MRCLITISVIELANPISNRVISSKELRMWPLSISEVSRDMDMGISNDEGRQVINKSVE